MIWLGCHGLWIGINGCKRVEITLKRAKTSKTTFERAKNAAKKQTNQYKLRISNRFCATDGAERALGFAWWMNRVLYLLDLLDLSV